jgi:hypothetical protein
MSEPLENPVLHFSSDVFKCATQKTGKKRAKVQPTQTPEPSVTPSQEATAQTRVSKIETLRQRLTKLETRIRAGLETFLEVGNALLEIRDSKLYRLDYATFEDYCRDKWHISRPRAYQLIKAASVVGNLSTKVDISLANNESQAGDSPIGRLTHPPLPPNERQVRELAGLEPEKQREVWTDSVKSAAGKRPTAKQVREAKEKLPTAAKPITLEHSKLVKKVQQPFDKFISSLLENIHASQHHEVLRLISDDCCARMEKQKPL